MIDEATTAKPHFMQVTDAAESAALQLTPKYRDDAPHWVRRGAQLWVLVDEQWKAWRAAQAPGKPCEPYQ